MAIVMQKSRKTRLHLDRETVRSLDPRQLSRAAGGVEPTMVGTHCHSCRGPICVSNTDCSVLC
jgi:hypothetical protein